MKKSIFLLALAAMFTLVSCGDDKPKAPKQINVTIKVSEDKLEAGQPSPESYNVTLTNTSTMASATFATENKEATVTGILPGIYNITVSAETVKDAYSYTYAGSLSDVDMTTDGQIVFVEVSAVKASALVIKELYYTGRSKINADGTEDTYFRDQFCEIYNNSSETVYADGLCFATLKFANYDFSTIYTYEIPNAENYVFVPEVWQVPGTGSEYPIKPGESIVIAQWGTNHQAASLLNTKDALDLSGADFEFLLKTGPLWGGVTITDEAAINMVHAVNAKGWDPYQYLLSVSGECFIIFKPTVALRQSDFLTSPNDEYASNSLALEVQISDVIDAVQAVGDETRISTLGMPAILDAGYIWCSGTYVGESISRKIKETKPDGQIIYQDTNNTTNDFEVNKTPVVRRNGAGVPAWNTWSK